MDTRRLEYVLIALGWAWFAAAMVVCMGLVVVRALGPHAPRVPTGLAIVASLWGTIVLFAVALAKETI